MIVLLTASLCVGCIEEFDPNLETREPVIVIDAKFSDIMRNTEVVVSRSFDFEVLTTNRGVIADSRISGADIKIFNNNNELCVDFIESDEKGIYIPAFYDIKGTSFRLVADIDDSRYISDYKEFPDKPAVDSVWSQLRTEEIFNENGEVVDEREFIGIKAKLNHSEDNNYYNFEGQLLVSVDILDPEPPFAGQPCVLTPSQRYCNIYYADVVDGINIYSTESINSTSSTINALEVPLRNRDQNLALLEIESLSRESYEFSEILRSQLQSQNSIFSATLKPLEGNIRNENDDSELIIGNFTLSKTTTVTLCYNTMGIGGKFKYLRGQASDCNDSCTNIFYNSVSGRLAIFDQSDLYFNQSCE